MRTPSPSWCGLDRTHLWPTGSSLGDPIDYGPELLLMPFGFHLAMDTLPSGDRKWWLQVRLGCIRLSSSCPFRRLHTFHFSGQRGFQPRFWIQCSSSEHRRDFRSGFRSALAVSDFRLRARLDVSIPSTSPASEAFNPAFGYSAPHPSTGGTSTLLINALL